MINTDTLALPTGSAAAADCVSPEAWLHLIQTAVGRRLQELFDEKEAQAAALHPALLDLVGAIRDLTMRGGKRLRPAMVVAGFYAVSSDPDLAAIVDAAVAAELLQTFLLIHDDWMDRDDTRRGQPTVHVMLSAKYGNTHTGASAAILAGNLAGAYAWEALTSAAFPAGLMRLAVQAFWEMEEQVGLGQFLDLVGCRSVLTVHTLKSASYSVRGPLRIGALLGGGAPDQLDALDRYAWPLGIAFQLRDDLLSTFGDPKETGKPIGNDLRCGKQTALIVDALEKADQKGLSILRSVLGKPDATGEEIVAAIRLLEHCGSRLRVENELQECVEQALGALEGARLDSHGVALLRTLAAWIANRSR